jgi:hypothetical protein
MMAGFCIGAIVFAVALIGLVACYLIISGHVDP